MLGAPMLGRIASLFGWNACCFVLNNVAIITILFGTDCDHHLAGVLKLVHCCFELDLATVLVLWYMKQILRHLLTIHTQSQLMCLFFPPACLI